MKMPVKLNLDVLLLQRGISPDTVIASTGISADDLNKLMTNQITGLRIETITMICEFLECQPGDFLKYYSAEN